MIFREIEKNDIPSLFTIRTATDQNNLSMQQLTELGITPDTVKNKLEDSYKGWLCEIDYKPVGFAMGNKGTGEMWVIAMLPEYINKGIGSKLLQLVEEWLFTNGCKSLWLTTDIDTKLRAYSFYLKNGWKDSEIKNGCRYMVKCK